MEQRRIAFQFPIGARVQVGGDTSVVYVVLQQRYTTRPELAPIIEYLVQVAESHSMVCWVYEPDLVPA